MSDNHEILSLVCEKDFGLVMELSAKGLDTLVGDRGYANA
jgi:hypothetical protein